MIVAVGPGTPASLMTRSTATSSASSSASSSSAESSSEDDASEDEDGDDESGAGVLEGDSMEDDGYRLVEDADFVEANIDSNDDGDHANLRMSYDEASHQNWRPSMRHGGCINTAAWMDCGWRLSSGNSIEEGEESPTQVLTSGDDLSIKVWDVRTAMGTTSPVVAEAKATLCPFATSVPKTGEGSGTNSNSSFVGRNPEKNPGNILELAALQTGHSRNIFHVTPMRGRPGKVATCGADGEMRVTDLESGNPSVIVGERAVSDDQMFEFRRRQDMCFSHHFLDTNNGLLCTERGLYRFDVRVSSREQPTGNLLGSKIRSCKACAVWSPPGSRWDEGGSTYVFGKFAGAD